MDCNDDCENAEASIRVNLEFDSNEITEIDRHEEKQDDPSISTERGTVTFGT
jgi:hypothetical protein